MHDVPNPCELMNHQRRAWFRVLGGWVTVLSGLPISLLAPQAMAETRPVRSTWREYKFDSLGVRLSYPGHCVAWVEDGGLFIRLKSSHSPKSKGPPLEPQADRAMNGRILGQDGQYLVHLSLASGDFAFANSKHRIFERSGQSMRVALGRFENPTADRLERNGWKGYESSIVCSRVDQETGFHAAGGNCYWALVSDGSRYALIDSQPLTAQEEQMVRKIVKSLRFYKP